jgi:hypothetical protein
MKRKGVLPLMTISAVLCLGDIGPSSAGVKQAARDPQPARLYVRLLGTSQ